jgi:hypothetical protein
MRQRITAPKIKEVVLWSEQTCRKGYANNLFVTATAAHLLGFLQLKVAAEIFSA